MSSSLGSTALDKYNQERVCHEMRATKMQTPMIFLSLLYAD